MRTSELAFAFSMQATNFAPVLRTTAIPHQCLPRLVATMRDRVLLEGYKRDLVYRTKCAFYCLPHHINQSEWEAYRSLSHLLIPFYHHNS